MNKYSLKKVLKPLLTMNSIPLQRNQVQFMTHAKQDTINWNYETVDFKDITINVQMYFFRTKSP